MRPRALGSEPPLTAGRGAPEHRPRGDAPAPPKAGGDIEIELLGLARLLARRERLRLPADGPMPLRACLRAAAREAPALVGTVLTETGELLAGHALSRDGLVLLVEGEAPVLPGDRLLLFSTTAGG